MKSVFIVFLFLLACVQKENPVKPHDPGNLTPGSVDMGSDYRWQVYYDLRTNTEVGRNLKTAWDLGFESADTGFRVVLNTAKAMFVRDLGDTAFASVTGAPDFESHKRWDAPSGNLDSTAIGNWRQGRHVFLIDRGYNESGSSLGFRKVEFSSAGASQYTLRFASLNGAGDTTLLITKDSTYNFVFLSLDGGGAVKKIEPPRSDWDLVFTQYVHVFDSAGVVTPYLVTGCLLNPYPTAAKVDSHRKFEEIGYEEASAETLSAARNSIGYTWKVYSFDTGKYSTRSEFTYILRDAEGFYYKLHFVDFYNALGVKGNPVWEYQPL